MNFNDLAVYDMLDIGFNSPYYAQVEPYPGTAMSVWVYVASLVRRR